ncbi:MAG: fructose-6-phosphate aldolase [Dehalococcoidales bacterium]|nr:fructose-6-phosphate aldolase [Dehalococcoidales bacterium]
MRIFLDTANVEEIAHGVKIGVVSGVTTNPSLVSKEGCRSYQELVQKICTVTSDDVSVEVTEENVEGMLAQARQISKWAPNVVVKIPATEPGLEATSILTREGIRINMTLCFSLNQALLAALAGASYISPFVGRLDDIGEDGMALIADIVNLYNRHAYETKVLAASIRHPYHVLHAARVGAHVITMPYNVLKQMIKHPLTDIGIERFLSDWRQSGSAFS